MDIVLSDVSIVRNGRSILNRASAVFPFGHIHALIGKNGAGKSSLFQALIGLLPYQGTIFIDKETPLSSLSSLAIAQKIAYLPQQNPISFPLSVQDYVLMGRFPHLSKWQNYSLEDKEMAMFQLEKLAILPLATRNIQALSGGEFQKVVLARALTQATNVLLLDEPSSALDPKQKLFLYEFLFDLAKSKTIICATHDRELISDERANLWALNHAELLHLGRGSEANFRDSLANVY